VKPAATLMLALALANPILGLDHSIASAVQAHRTRSGDRVMQAATDLGKHDVLFGLLLGLAILDPAGAGTARLAVASLVATNLVVEILKRIVRRVRPDGDTNPVNAAFPSGHAASAFGLALVFVRRWGKAAWFTWLLAALVAFSRIWLNRHWFSDVVSGALIGLLCTWAVLRVVDRWQARRGRAGPPTPGGARSRA
jgi:undecaprenyl-diphosphatase